MKIPVYDELEAEMALELKRASWGQAFAASGLDNVVLSAGLAGLKSWSWRCSGLRKSVLFFL